MLRQELNNQGNVSRQGHDYLSTLQDDMMTHRRRCMMELAEKDKEIATVESNEHIKISQVKHIAERLDSELQEMTIEKNRLTHHLQAESLRLYDCEAHVSAFIIRSVSCKR